MADTSEPAGIPADSAPAPALEGSDMPLKRSLAEAPEPALTSGDDGGEHRPKRAKTGGVGSVEDKTCEAVTSERRLGIASIKKEYLIEGPISDAREGDVDDDAAEGRQDGDGRGGLGGGRKGRKKKAHGGQNKDRDFGHSRDALRLCGSLVHTREFAPKTCRAGERCRSIHDLRQYLREGRRGDLMTFGGVCPVFATYGRCPSGWKCRFVSSHMQEATLEDGRQELQLVDRTKREEKDAAHADSAAGEIVYEDDGAHPDVVNVVPSVEKQNLTRRRTVLERSTQYLTWLDREMQIVKKIYHNGKSKGEAEDEAEGKPNGEETRPDADADADAAATVQDLRAQFTEPPFLPSEKRRLYFGPETPTLAPLTTQGNLPLRRLCVELGCEVTYSEMALGVDLLTGKQPEWALMKAHASEVVPPQFKATGTVVAGYDHAADVRFGAQIAANQPWMAIKATEALARLLPYVRVVDLNCGCPIDLVYRNGGGSGLLEAHNKLERMVRGMNAVSGSIPISAKLRIGVRDHHPTAPKVLECLAFGGVEARARLGAPGCAAVTLHGRTRNQRYKKPADWGYIAECAALVRQYNETRDAIADTVREPDPRTQANGGHIFFLGNGDCYSHEQYAEQLAQSGVDAVMIGRGAIVKPWLFEEIRAGQYLDKTATERLAYLEAFARYGMEAWGTDEMGLGTTRRFLLEHLSFTSRYVPIGLLEHLPPSLNDRPPAFRGRNELETLLASRNYKDWIKISDMFLGPAHEDFKFVPKHKSNSYDMEAEG